MLVPKARPNDPAYKPPKKSTARCLIMAVRIRAIQPALDDPVKGEG